MNLPRLPKIRRYMVCIILLAVIFLIYTGRLAEWQLLQGEEFREQALSDMTDSIELPAARGGIWDCNGVVLAGNKTSYNVVYNALNMVYEERNATIVRLINLLKERGEKWRDVLPIRLDEEGNYVFAKDREGDIASLKERFDLAEYAGAEECMAALMEEYDCAGFSKEDTRVVASVRYSMTRDGYSRTNPYVIAEDVSVETVGVLQERAEEFPGIEPRVSVARYYGEEGGLAPHVVGYSGAITGEQYDRAAADGTAYDSEKNPFGYKWVDTRGQAGVEYAFEEELRGKRGRESILMDENGNVKSVTVTRSPENGHTVRLTLDSRLQRVANFSLEENIKANVEARNCEAGAAVVLDVKTFGVLASASYPSFDMNLYRTDDSYTEKMHTDPSSPMFNRALEGSFAPGSVFKPMVALAALQEGVISASSTPYFCDRTFKYFDLTLRCTDYHGYADIYTALAGSCNCFFCQTGLDLTIRKMDAYAEYFSLGSKTGVELGEAEGIMSDPQEYAQNHPGFTWTDGLTAQTAIGQCDNMFTPIQLAAYCATIANNGVRLKTHFLQEITDYTGEEVLETYRPQVVSDAGLSADVLGVVQEGMRMVVTDSVYGTANKVFGEYPISIAAKTGTAETSSDEETDPNLTFIAYAPADDPQIAVAVVMEKGKSGIYAQNVAKDILDQYFGFVTRDAQGNRYNSDGDMIDREGKVLKTKEQVEREKAAAMASPSPSPEGEEGGEEPASSPESGGTSQAPESSGPDHSGNDIPDRPYTGENTGAPESSLPEESALPAGADVTSAPSGRPGSPFYRGDQSESSGGGP